MSDPARFFDAERAAVYDAQADRMAPFRDALHLGLRAVLASLPARARILCVGAGTGSELLALAATYPDWHFTAVDPAPAMLARCQERVAAAGLLDRCSFHQGVLGTLPTTDPFHAATVILVSQFLVETAARRQLFVDVASRLRPGGLLASCDLATEPGTPTFESLYDVWAATFKHVGLPAPAREIFGTAVGMLSPQALERLIASSGFEAPVPFFQAVLMHGWFARRFVDR